MFIAAGIFIPLQWKNDLPATLPTHWGSNGPDAFGTLTEFLVVPSVTFGLVIVFFGILFHVIARDISIQRIGIVANIFVSGLSASITISTAAQARGVTDPTTIDFPAAVVSFSALGSLALGLLLSLSLPRPTYEAAQGLPDVTAPRADLTVHENAAWFIRQFSASSVWFGMGSIPTVAILAFHYPCVGCSHSGSLPCLCFTGIVYVGCSS
ncbi:hypothetical protein [Timonella sp. A28]|uniref:hypothetical protein n=1 Tax=Timonella sp. A28 TaxID=3442640 RepID=UPI003EBB6A96